MIDVCATHSVEPGTWDEIWQLTRLFYDTERDYAEASLKMRPQIVLVRSRADRTLVGLISLEVLPFVCQGRSLAAIYTSHVLLREEYRGLNLIQRIGFGQFLKTRGRYPLRPIFWFFDTFSYKSYLLLPRNFLTYWPRFDSPTPSWEHTLIDALANRIYGASWIPSQGIVARSGRKRLKADAAPLEPHLAAVQDLEFFARANPGHAEGDMLVCLCPLSALNWLTAALRAVRRWWASGA